MSYGICERPCGLWRIDSSKQGIPQDRCTGGKCSVPTGLRDARHSEPVRLIPAKSVPRPIPEQALHQLPGSLVTVEDVESQ